MYSAFAAPYIEVAQKIALKTSNLFIFGASVFHRGLCRLPMAASSELVLVEEDSDGGCSWCPVATEEGNEDEKAALDLWTKGEELRKSKKWAEALVYFNRAVVANPQNAACWSSISKVSRSKPRVSCVCECV